MTFCGLEVRAMHGGYNDVVSHHEFEREHGIGATGIAGYCLKCQSDLAQYPPWDAWE